MERIAVEINVSTNFTYPLHGFATLVAYLKDGYEVERVDKITHKNEEALIYILSRYER